MLIGIETLLQVFDEKVAVAESGPSWTVIWVNVGKLKVVLYSMVVLSIGCAVLSKLVQVVYIHNVVRGLPARVPGTGRGLASRQSRWL